MAGEGGARDRRGTEPSVFSGWTWVPAFAGMSG
jgi:hypothetical protein